MPNKHKYLILFLFFLIISAQRGEATEQSHDIRALWVTRWDYNSPYDIEQIVQNASSHHFNLILFQVRGDGSVSYPSTIEPWSKSFNGRDPGWNPLKTAIELAHQSGIQLHAWINLLPGWSGNAPPDNPDHIFYTHPDWFMQDISREQLPLNSHYIWLNPVLPGVQRYLADIVYELSEVNGLDGIHFDYFRFPGPGLSYDEKSLALFKNQYGLEPTESTRLWAKFRRDAITEWLRKVYTKIKTAQPGLIISSTVIGDYDNGVNLYMQDSHHWIWEGIIDLIFPMAYTDDFTLLRRWLTLHDDPELAPHICPGLMVYPDENILHQEISIVREYHFAGVSYFSYSNLFPGHQPNEIAKTLKEKYFRDSVAVQFVDHHREKPLFEDIRFFPPLPTSEDSIQIICKTSMVIQDSNYQVLGIWKNIGGTGYLEKVKFEQNLKEPVYWYNSTKVSPQAAGQRYSFQLFAFKPGQVMETKTASEPRTILIRTPEQIYISAGTFGPPMTSVTNATVDGRNRVWVHEPGQGIRIFDHNGQRLNLQPISKYTDEQGNTKNIHYIYGMVTLASGAIAVLAGANGSSMILTNRDFATELSVLCRLPIKGLSISVNSQNYFYILTKSDWYVLDPTGQILGTFNLKGIHSPNNISVTPDGKTVFIACRSEGTVHRWIGEVSRFAATYQQISDIKESEVGLGEVHCDRNGFIYLTSTPGQYTKVLDSRLHLVDLLFDGKPGLQAPRAARPSPDGRFILIIEIGATTPIQILKWEKLKSD